MHLQEARRADAARTADADPDASDAAPSLAATAARGGGAAAAAGLAIPFARGFDAFGMGATVVVHLPLTDEPAAAGAEEFRAVPADAMRPVEPQAPWIVAGLKLVALAAGLGCAYLAGGWLLGAPAGAGARAPQALVEPAR